VAEGPFAAWTYANTWESIADALPDAEAIVQGEAVLTWREFNAAADALAAELLSAGLGRQAKVAVYMANRAQYLVAYFAAFKAGLAPFNVNYRYGPEEVAYLLDNADAEAVIFEAGYAPVLAASRDRFLGVKRWIAVAQHGAPSPSWAQAYDEAVALTPPTRPVTAPWGRSSEDLFLLYTGGTTGMPKGVMWRQGDLLARGGYGANPAAGLGPLSAAGAGGARAAAQASRVRSLIPCPLMHGTGLIAALSALNAGGTVILPPAGRFDAERLWDVAERSGATRITIAGQSFALPMLEALEAHPGLWDLTRLTAITSSGAMWSAQTKQDLLTHLPWAQMVDSYSSSEAMGVGSRSRRPTVWSRPRGSPSGPTARCSARMASAWRPARASAADRLGRLWTRGYYKDPDKSARTFPVMEGRRWSVPGDWALVEADGAIRLLGRGSQCINTGGEKVFPEEVEEALKTHHAVRDAAVVGVPDARFGERIMALVELGEGGASEDALRDHVRRPPGRIQGPAPDPGPVESGPRVPTASSTTPP
jgi:acyl-CoA synthetase (AMP-forming)/AMP-acid ligase II